MTVPALAWASAACAATLLLTLPGCGARPSAGGRASALVFASVGVDGRLDIFTAPASGGPRVNLTSTGAADESFPRWSADGARLGWIRGGRPGQGRLVVANPDGSQATEIVPHLEIRSFGWAPDGRSVAAATFDLGGTIALVDLTSGAVTRASRERKRRTRRTSPTTDTTSSSARSFRATTRSTTSRSTPTGRGASRRHRTSTTSVPATRPATSGSSGRRAASPATQSA